MNDLCAFLVLLASQEHTPGPDFALQLMAPRDIIELVAFGGGVLLFVLLALVFVVRSRRRRIEELTENLRDMESPEFAKVPEPKQLQPEEKTPEPPQLTPEERADQILADQESRAKSKQQAKEEAAKQEKSKVKAQAEAEAEQKEKRRKRLHQGLSRTRTGFVGRLTGLFSGKQTLDDDLIEELEHILVTSDIGVKTADHLLDLVRTKISKKEVDNPNKVRALLKDEIASLLALENKPLTDDSKKPLVIMVVGVNGGGKTTTIGKLAHRLKAQGKSVVLGAGDTFRAAAADQLEVWAERAGVEIVRGKEAQDPSSVLFDAVKRAKENDSDIVIADTAGRLHTKVNLMEELKKVQRVLCKACDGAPHEVLLVLDATTGQNAIAQASQFNAAIPLTGVVLTKLDGTAKGGVIVGICQEHKIPVRFIGIGEKIDDLRPFEAREFVDALFAEE